MQHDISYFGKRLKEQREKKGLTQAELGELVWPVPHSGNDDSIFRAKETARKKIQSYENGKFPKEYSDLCRIADILECDIDYLFGAQEQPQKMVVDAATTTGLSYSAVELLSSWKTIAPLDLEAISHTLCNSPTIARNIIRSMYFYIGLKKHDPDSKSLFLSKNQEILEIMDSDEKNAIRRKLSGEYSEYAAEYMLTKARLTADDIAVVYLKSAQDELANLFKEMLLLEKPCGEDGGLINGKYQKNSQ